MEYATGEAKWWPVVPRSKQLMQCQAAEETRGPRRTGAHRRGEERRAPAGKFAPSDPLAVNAPPPVVCP
jgi:hypothetical protein